MSHKRRATTKQRLLNGVADRHRALKAEIPRINAQSAKKFHYGGTAATNGNATGTSVAKQNPVWLLLLAGAIVWMECAEPDWNDSGIPGPRDQRIDLTRRRKTRRRLASLMGMTQSRAPADPPISPAQI